MLSNAQKREVDIWTTTLQYSKSLINHPRSGRANFNRPNERESAIYYFNYRTREHDLRYREELQRISTNSQEQACRDSKVLEWEQLARVVRSAT
jgi:hypothetical protein